MRFRCPLAIIAAKKNTIRKWKLACKGLGGSLSTAVIIMSKRYVDDILSSDAGSSDSDLSFENINGDDYRIDVDERDIGKRNTTSRAHDDLRAGPPYNLEGVFEMPEEPVTPRTENANNNELSDDYQDENDNTMVKDIVTPPRERKRVRFGVNEKDDSEDYSNVNPWDFKRLIRKLYKEQLPDTYQIRNWKRPQRELVTSFIEMIENNVELASAEVFDQYGDELDRFYKSNGERDDLKEKLEVNVYDIIYNIKKRLKRTKFPSKIWVDNLDLEYVYAKGEFIKKRYESELDHAEEIERQLLREEEHVKSLKLEGEAKIKKHKETLTAELSELSKNLHPSLSTALTNSFGLIKDSQMSNTIYQRDKLDFNLRLKTDFSQPLKLDSDDTADNDVMQTLKSAQNLADEILGKLSNITG